MKNLLCEVLSMCFRISCESEADVFFEYSPHCGSYSVYWYCDGWKPEKSFAFEWLNCTTDITCENLKNTLEKLNAIATELGVM